MKRSACLVSMFAVMLFWLASISTADIEFGDFEAQTFKGKKELPYLLYSPAKIKAGTKVPLVVFLHGIGARGDDNQKQLAYTRFLDQEAFLTSMRAFPPCCWCMMAFKFEDVSRTNSQWPCGIPLFVTTASPNQDVCPHLLPNYYCKLIVQWMFLRWKSASLISL